MREWTSRPSDTVLIVDDHLDTLECLAEIVSERGLRPLLATNGRQALELLGRLNGPCLILLDLFMPVMDGFQFLRALERYESSGDYPVVVMTASNSVTPIHSSVVARLNRPFRLEDVHWVLDHLDPSSRAPPLTGSAPPPQLDLW
jgi:CheY-like chemotaxis protein